MSWTDDYNDKVLDGIKCNKCGIEMEDAGELMWD